MGKRVAFATCSKFPALSDDDRPLIAELARLGVTAEPAVWSEPREWAAYDAVVIRSTWYYWLEHERFLGWLGQLEAGGCRVFNPVPVLRDNIDKRYLARLEKEGFPIVPTKWLEPGEELRGLMDRNGWDEAIVKPVISGNAEWTYRVDRRRAGERALLEPAWRLGPAMIQPFVPSIISKGEYSLLFFNGEFSHAVVKRAAQGDFRVQHEHGGTIEAVTVDRSWIELAGRILASAGKPLLYARVDMALHEDRPCLMELELTEPFLYLADAPGSASRFARALADRLA